GHAGHTLLAPEECRDNAVVYDYLETLKAEHAAIDDVLYFDLRQSMKNGGGPACLRLRVVMGGWQIAQCPGCVFSDQAAQAALNTWIERHYRDDPQPQDRRSPDWSAEPRRALYELPPLLALRKTSAFHAGN